MDDHGPRSMVPPRREQLIDQYTLAHQAAVEEKEAADRFEAFAESSLNRKDLRAAAGSWEGACRATSNALRHRRAELEMRKQEYSLYNHLDDEEKLYGQRLLIEYSERRLERLRDDSSKAICKSRIAHLRSKGADARWENKMMEQQIVKEDLHNRSRGHGAMMDGHARQAPHLSHVYLNDAGQKLRWLQGRIRWNLRALDQRDAEIIQNEEEWERIREKERQREPEWKRLDDEARSYWSGERTRPPPVPVHQPTQRVEVDESDVSDFDIEAEKIQRQVAESARLEAEALRIQAMEDEAMDRDDAPSWEEEYGNALEEDPDFTAPVQQYSALNLEDKQSSPQVGPTFDELAASLLAEAEDGDQTAKPGLFVKDEYDSGSDNDASGSVELSEDQASKVGNGWIRNA